MAVFKCKMCGGELNITEGMTVAECEYCGSVQTVPTADNEKKITLFARANRLRAGCEFDKAAGVYETIVADFPEEAEAYWGLVLCKYGIEYVDDPATGKKIPTCHRSSFTSVLEDSDFEQALENADVMARKVYREEARQIEEIRKGIIAVSANEQPYDIFICYKETAENGERTLDSVLAQDIYDALTDKGYRVFFSRITLEDKLGMEYEPYIFAALNSAKVMLAVGTDYEYYNAVWVKNEWSRYLKLIEQDKSKHLIPCFKGIDAYDMPKEFARLQAQDMGKIGAMQDLLRGIEKILPREQPVTVVQEKVVVGGSGDNKIASLLDRGNMALEDGDWAKADSFFEDVLNNDSKNAQAYLGKTLAQEKCRTIDAFARKRKEATQNVRGETLQLQPDEKHIAAAVERFSLKGYVTEDSIRALYQFDLSYHSNVAERQRQYTAEEKYWADHKQLSRAEKFAAGAVAEALAREKKALLAALKGRMKKAQDTEAAAIRDVQERYAQHLKQADAQAEALYQDGVEHREADYQLLLQIAKTSNDVDELHRAAGEFYDFGDYQDSKNLADHCCKRAAEEQAKLDAEAERQRVEKERAENVRAAKNKKISIIVGIAAVVALAVILVVTQVVIPNSRYNEAMALMDAGQYEEAIVAFETMDGYRDSTEQISECKYLSVVALMEEGYYDAAIAGFERLAKSKSADDKQPSDLSVPDSPSDQSVPDSSYEDEENPFIEQYGELNKYGDYADDVAECIYRMGAEALDANQYDKATYAFEAINGYKDSAERLEIVLDTQYELIEELINNGDIVQAAIAFGKLGYQDSTERSANLWSEIVERKVVSTGLIHTLGLKTDGTVVAAGYEDEDDRCAVSDWTGITAIVAENGQSFGLRKDGTVLACGYNEYGQCDVSDWTNIVAIEAGNCHTVGLKSDGTVVAVGLNKSGECNVSGWMDIVAISVSDSVTVGLNSDGTVVTAGRNEYNLSDWTDIVAIDANEYHIVGLKSDGTVVAAGNNYYGQCDVSAWTNITAISAGLVHTLGLKTDGTVVAAGYEDEDDRCAVSDWTGITAIVAENGQSFGLRKDGTVLACGYNEYGQCDVSDWTNIVAIEAGRFHTVGLKSDGTVVAVGLNKSGQCNVSGWMDIKLPK